MASQYDRPEYSTIRYLNWAEMRDRDHFVQFYSEESDIVEAVASYFAHGLRFGDVCIIAGTHEHNAAIESLVARLVKPFDRTGEGNLIVLDAHETLSKFMIDGRPDPELFENVVGSLIRDAAASKRPIRIFGEMVDVLAKDGKAAAAVALEHLWNDLGRKFDFRLFCGYAEDSLRHPASIPHTHEICASHNHVLRTHS